MLRPEEFAILPWGPTKGDQKVFDDIRECGFNLAGFVNVDDLDKVAKAGLKCFVEDPTTHIDAAIRENWDDADIERRVQELVKRVNGHEGVYGYYLRDEPHTDMFPLLSKCAKAYRSAAPKSVPYVNLFPNYASKEQLHIDSYDGYIDAFVEQVKPDFISYDHYALMEDGSIRYGYFENLESMREASIRHNLPFYNCILSNAHFDYAEPSPATLRFQVYTSLAYGARGISFFTYFSPRPGNFRLAPIDQYGQKTPTWDMLRNVISAIHTIGPVYITLKSVNVFHSDGVMHSKFMKSVRGDNLLVGEFNGPNDEPFIMLVNKNLYKSTSFGLEFKDQGDLYRVNPYTGTIDRFGGEDNWLAAGQGVLLCLKR